VITSWQLYREVLDTLPGRARRFLAGYSFALGFLSVLDAAALAGLALLIGPLVTGNTVKIPFVGVLGTSGILTALGILCVFIVLKGILALAISWRATRRLSSFELNLGSRLFDSYLNSAWTERLKRNSSDIVRMTDSSVNATVSGFILPTTSLLSEALSFLTIVVVITLAQPVVALIALAYLGSLAVVLFLAVTKRQRQAGQVALRYSLRSTRLITEMVGALKEVTLRNKTHEAAAVVRENRSHSTRARANTQFLTQVPRYVVDSGIVGGFVLVAAVGYFLNGSSGAISSVALFGLAGFRLAPSVVRFQGILSQIAVSKPHAEAVLEEIQRSEAHVDSSRNTVQVDFPDEPSVLSFEKVSFRYSAHTKAAVSNVSLEIPFGSSVAFVGSSGAGKSTMIDLVLGLIEPTKGTISVDGVPLPSLREAWRERISYVPQDVALFDATIAQNVALTWSPNVDLPRVRSALRSAQLLATLEKRPGGLDAKIGERGLALSGGQRQRLGIARALYSNPLVLVLDEATSALDTATEASVTEAIRSLRGSMTIVTVAHRLATVKEADLIFFMRNGRVAAHGTFSELVSTVPDFAHQAALAGLA
jgi:ABC-type bacteriocin/lantibiotic exporter with double-glycine peptidase domain